MRLSNIIFPFALTFLLTACSLPKPEKESTENSEQDSASFYIISSKAEFTKETSYHAKMQIPTGRELSLKVCLADNLRSRTIVGHTFTIKGDTFETQTKTDGNGCLIWQEKVEFNFLNEEKYVMFRRQIISEGVQKGARSLELAINPWSETVYSSIDSRVKNLVDKGESLTTLTGDHSSGSSLWADGMRVNIMQEQIRDGKGTYKLELTGSLQGERKGLNGERRFFDITATEGIANLKLICAIHPQGRKPERKILAVMDNVKGQSMNAGKFVLSSRFELTQFCPSGGFNMISMSLRIKDGEQVIRPFEGLFHIGPVQNFGGPVFSVHDGEFTARFQENRNLTVDSFLKEGNNVTTTGGTTSTDFLQTYRVEVARLEFGSLANRLNASKKMRERAFTVTACFRISADQTNLRAVTMEVQKINGQTTKDQQTKTQNDGCITFEDFIQYNHFGQECWIEKKLKFRNEDLGMNQDFKVLINPWSQASGWAIDARYSSGSQMARCTQGASHIMLDSYSMDYSTGRFHYAVDEFLNLNYMRDGNIHLSPRLVRSSFGANQGSYSDPEPLPVGRYLLRYALIDQSITDYSQSSSFSKRIYSIGRTILNVREDGRVIDTVRITTPAEALMSLGLLNQFILEIVPIKESTPAVIAAAETLESYVDEDHVIQVTPYVAQFIARAEGGLLRRLDSWMGRSLVKELDLVVNKDRRQSLEKNRQLAKKENHSTNYNLELINLNKEDQAEKFRVVLSKSGPRFQNANLLSPLTLNDIKLMVKDGKINRKDVYNLCGYFFKTLWTQNVHGKNYGMISDAKLGDELTHHCASIASGDLSQVFDIEHKYFIKGAKILNDRGCEAPTQYNSRCAAEGGNPEEVLIRGFSAQNNFSLSKDFSFSEGTKAELGLNAGVSKYIGIGGGAGYSVGKSRSEGQSSSQSFSAGQSFTVESLKFRLKSKESEKCLSIRLSPTLFDRQEKSLVFWTQSSKFARSLNPNLSSLEKAWGQKRGLLICEGERMESAHEFMETYHILRPSSEMGILGDERSRAKVDGLFMSLRGINDLTALISSIQGTGAIPESFYPELTARQLTADRAKEAISRGSRAAPGVFSSTLH